MAERKRRGLGRGLGALINSDSQDQEYQQQKEGAETASLASETEKQTSSGPVSRETAEGRSSAPVRSMCSFPRNRISKGRM